MRMLETPAISVEQCLGACKLNFGEEKLRIKHLSTHRKGYQTMYQNYVNTKIGKETPHRILRNLHGTNRGIF